MRPPCKQGITCENRTGADLLRYASSQFRPDSDTLRHIYSAKLALDLLAFRIRPSLTIGRALC